MKQALSLTARRFIVFAFDLVAIGLAYFAAFLLRFDFKIPPEIATTMWSGLPWIYGIQSVVLISQNLYRGLWHFASLRDLYLILRATTLSVVLSVAVIALFWDHLIGWPRSVFIIDGVLLMTVLGGGRFAYRFGRELYWSMARKRKRILVIGAGHSANLISREFSSRPELSAQVVGFLDDSAVLRGVRIHGTPVLGPIDSLEKWLKTLEPAEVIIAIPSLSGSRVKQILAACQPFNVPCRICPPIQDVLLGRVALSQLREIRVEDLLRRDVVTVDDQGLADFIRSKRIVITGAGGSIGSELCRQVLKFQPATLVMYERSEFNLYRFEQELKRNPSMAGDTQLAFVVGDILNEKKLTWLFEHFQPEIVLHAAAYKHVPLMEENVFEALSNNVLGTYRLTTAAAKSGTQNFILISTDKAVRPTSVMGATKRMAELVTQEIGKATGMQTAAVRFGNVLDSEGSVLPLFREQISRGGPITVTHPEVTRYFMTIPEASQLVLQAAMMAHGGDVFLLDMGEPVLIRELAEELIKLSGQRPFEDIDIVFTGLRRGEKLYEELLIDPKHTERTCHYKILLSTREFNQRLPSDWRDELYRLYDGAAFPADAELREWIRKWVPEYRSPVHPIPATPVIPIELSHEQ